MTFRMFSCLPLVCLLLLQTLRSASATYSVVGTDSETRQVGGSGCTCIPGGDVYRYLYRGVPNRGVLHTQARVSQNLGSSRHVTAALDLLKRVAPLSEVLSALYRLDGGSTFFRGIWFRLADLRQYGLADFTSHAGFTGKEIDDNYRLSGFSGTVQEDNGGFVDGRYNYHAQGNIVLPGTVTSMQRGFESLGRGTADIAETCDLAGRLMAALQEVPRSNQGDKRCTPSVSGTSAFVTVDNPDGSKYLELNVVGNGSFEPIDELYNQFKRWRASNPCPGGKAPPVPTKAPTKLPVPAPVLAPVPAPMKAPLPAPLSIPAPVQAPVPFVVPTPVPRPVRNPDCVSLDGCFLEHLGTGQTTRLTAAGNTYSVDSDSAFSVFCNVSGQVGNVMFQYDMNTQIERVAPYYLGGDSGGKANDVSFLSECGTKSFQVSGSNAEATCFSQSFQMEGVC